MHVIAFYVYCLTAIELAVQRTLKAAFEELRPTDPHSPIVGNVERLSLVVLCMNVVFTNDVRSCSLFLA